MLAAIPAAWWPISLPQWLLTSAGYFAQMSLPLALICIGGTLSLAALREQRGGGQLSLMKLVWLPVLATLGAWCWGFRQADLAILFRPAAGLTAPPPDYVIVRPSTATINWRR